MTSVMIVVFFIISAVLWLASLVEGAWQSLLLSSVSLLCLGWVIFKDSMNLVQSVGPVYWIVRNNGKNGDRLIAKAFMRSTDAPWLVGSGVQFRAFRYSFQIGLCYPVPAETEEDGVLNAMQGRYMDEPAKEIGMWR